MNLPLSKHWSTFDSEHHLAGVTLPESDRVYRVKVVTAMLKAGVALRNIDNLRDLLVEHGYSLSSYTHRRQLVLFTRRLLINVLQ